jgi:hypothetical protein
MALFVWNIHNIFKVILLLQLRICISGPVFYVAELKRLYMLNYGCKPIAGLNFQSMNETNAMLFITKSLA